MIEIKPRTNPDGTDVVCTTDLSEESIKEISKWCDDRGVPLDFIKTRKGIKGYPDCYFVWLFGTYSLNGHDKAIATVKKLDREWSK